jgi:hypothetical protein
MTREHTLPTELVWQDDGHVGDVALAAIADGELEIVPERAISHAGACEICTARLGEQALLSLSASEAMTLLEPAPASAPARRPLPALSIALGLALAALGSAPAVIQLASGVAGMPEVALRGLLLASRAAATLVRTLAGAESASWTVLWMCATAVLLVLGALVARSARPTKEAA